MSTEGKTATTSNDQFSRSDIRRDSRYTRFHTSSDNTLSIPAKKIWTFNKWDSIVRIHKGIVIAVIRGRYSNVTNAVVTNQIRCASKRHQHHTRSGVPHRKFKKRLKHACLSSLACTWEFSTQRKNRKQAKFQTTFSTQNERWQGAMCVRRMIKKAHALRLANSLILCYGLRSFHRPSVPPSRVVIMINSFTRKPSYHWPLCV